jgi:hypothetical protein
MFSNRRGEKPRSNRRALNSRATVTPNAKDPSMPPSTAGDEPSATTTKVGISG